jgi:quinoprotein dehydrogenase-associated probable ABC transporter substrate-binding protein
VAVLTAVLAAGCAASESTPRAGAPVVSAQPPRVLHVVADPNNLPFSNERGEGFENRIAELVAREMGARVEYTWRAQRRGFFRHAFQDDGGDVVMGVPADFEKALTTSPYYRSSYVFVYRADRGLDVRSLDDPALRTSKIGIQVVGDEASATPGAYALARRGLVQNVIGYSIYGDYTQPNPPARIVDAVAAGEVDVGIVWGPLAGYFARRQPVKLEVVPVTPEVEPPGLTFAFAISVGVKKGDKALRDEVETILARNRAGVDKILEDFGVPRVPAAEEPNHGAAAPHAAAGE